ncbi:hypothetical protein MUU72_33510 [Streptomyces sp. RS10V-4]|uniref:hypothetical protein n=1 Tax=Streptomyces rhizoryzae TaxID=2932493 RepID=UPI002006D6B2|nr:hypothetical protein [Streptomyces rhizoryzae]MCK7627950.1 hypothetical protein [Streptomyces rhizoryzae]
MLDHLGIQVSGVAAGAGFHDRVPAPLGGAGVTDFGQVIGYGTDGRPAREVHSALTAADRAAVDAFRAAAVAGGATSLHAPRV